MSEWVKSALYQKVAIAYGCLFILGALVSSMAVALTGIKEWSDLTTVQWVQISCAIMSSTVTTTLAFLHQVASNAKKGRDIFSEGDTVTITKQQTERKTGQIQ